VIIFFIIKLLDLNFGENIFNNNKIGTRSSEAVVFLQKRGYTLEQFDKLNAEKVAVAQTDKATKSAAVTTILETPKPAVPERPEESIAKRLCCTLMQESILQNCYFGRNIFLKKIYPQIMDKFPPRTYSYT
jgi:hypothetical protein